MKIYYKDMQDYSVDKSTTFEGFMKVRIINDNIVIITNDNGEVHKTNRMITPEMARQFAYELLQCANVVEVAPDNKCWICGDPIEPEGGV